MLYISNIIASVYLTVRDEDEQMIMNADRYSGLVTVLAVLIAVFYVEESYDWWDVYLGIIGLALGIKYVANAADNGKLYVFLVASILSVSTVAVLFFIFEKSIFLRELVPFVSKNSFCTFIFGIAVWVLIIKFTPIKSLTNRSKMKPKSGAF